MKRILFVCHGNICRSPMAEFMLKQLVRQQGLEDEYDIASSATSTEEIGNDIYPPARETLRRHGVKFVHREARQITQADYESYDLIFAMDRNNLVWLKRILPEKITASREYAAKVRLLMSLTGEERDVADPWYTGDFEKAYNDISVALKGLIEQQRE